MADPEKGGAGADFGTAPGARPGPKVAEVKDAIVDAGSQVREKAGAIADDAKANFGATLATLKDQASDVADGAKGAVSSIAEEARQRLNDLIDQQKTAGADTIAGVARAATTAAGDLEKSSPQVARLVREAAAGVDRLAGDIRGSDLGDVLGTLTEFGRRQPVAFFGGAVLAGFVLARFLKSDAAPAPAAPQFNRPTQAGLSPRPGGSPRPIGPGAL